MPETGWRRAFDDPMHVVKGDDRRKRGYLRSIEWPSEVLRRAARAIHDARSIDSIVLAKAALQAAIRDELDLLELLPEPSGNPRRRAGHCAFVVVICPPKSALANGG